MSATVEDLTVEFEENGQILVKEIDKVVKINNVSKYFKHANGKSFMLPHKRFFLYFRDLIYINA